MASRRITTNKDRFAVFVRLYIFIGADVGVLGGGWGSTTPQKYPFGMFWVGSEEAQMESESTVYIFKQLKRIRIKIFCICIVCVLER